MNPDALAVAIDKLRDADVRRRMGQAGRARSHAEFTQEKMIERVEGVYESVLNEPRRS